MRVLLEASWAWGYGDTAELSSASDLIVVGKVTAIAYEGADADDPSLAATGFTITVAMSSANSVTEFIVKQTGGRLGNLIQEMRDDPLMRVGDDYLLFLKAIRGGRYDGQYYVLGGPQGRFRVKDGRAISNAYVAIPGELTLEGIVQSSPER